jgi:RNA-directed DNA polymerase
MNSCENSIDSSMNRTWKFPVSLLFKLQKRLFKASYILDKKKLFEFQKLILQSNCSRLLAIREVTQLSSNKNIPGVDGKISLNFSEKFELNECLKLNWSNWTFQCLKTVTNIEDKNNLVHLKISSLSDRTWQTLIKFALEPVHEAIFHPSNYGFRFNMSIHKAQKALILNMSKYSFSKQKRFMSVDMSKIFFSFNYNYLIKKILAPRSVKLGIFKLLEKGFTLEFPDQITNGSTFSSLLLNILIHGIESLQYSVRHGYYILFFLKPKHDEKLLLEKLKLFFLNLALNLSKVKITFFSSGRSFDFLGWHFKLTDINDDGLYIFPSYVNYQYLLKRVKRIINNSNYGSLTKVSKLYPIIKDWKMYNKYSDLLGPSYSLFFVRKRTFKIFNSESKQDFYSSKRLLSKCFFLTPFDKKLVNSIFNSTTIESFGHLVYLNIFNYEGKTFNLFFCIHCGVKTFEFQY